MALARRQMSLSFVLIIKLTTRIAAVHEATISAMYEVTLFLVYQTTLLTIRIKPTRPTTFTSREHQKVYKVS